MFVLTTPIPMPNANRWRVIQWKPVPLEARAIAVVEVLSPGATPRAQQFALNIRNGTCDQLVVNGGALSWNDSFVVRQIEKATGYDGFDSAAQGTGQNRVRAIETYLSTGFNADPALSTAIVSLGTGAVS